LTELIFQAIAISSAASSVKNTPRTYQLGRSKQMMNVSRYSASGSTQMKGTDAMFWVMWFETASSVHVPVLDNSSQSAIWPAVVGGAGKLESNAAFGTSPPVSLALTRSE
jgi:hypothetical protein